MRDKNKQWMAKALHAGCRRAGDSAVGDGLVPSRCPGNRCVSRATARLGGR